MPVWVSPTHKTDSTSGVCILRGAQGTAYGRRAEPFKGLAGCFEAVRSSSLGCVQVEGRECQVEHMDLAWLSRQGRQQEWPYPKQKEFPGRNLMTNAGATSSMSGEILNVPISNTDLSF